MSENYSDLDSFLSVDGNRKDFFEYLKSMPSNQNLLTLYLLLRCFKTQNNTDPVKLKQIIDRTYKTCILKHEEEIDKILGSLFSYRLSHCLKTGTYDESLLGQVTAIIKKVLDKEYVKFELKRERIIIKTRACTSSVSSSLGPKSGSSLSLNQLTNPYHVKTKPVKSSKQIDTQSLHETRRSKKSINSSLRKSKNKNEVKKADNSNIFDLTAQLEKIKVNSSNIEHQLDAHLEHVSRIKSLKLRGNNSLCQNSKENKKPSGDVKTTVAYYMPGESLAYLTTFNAIEITLEQFKNLMTKRGDFRYFFKTKTDLLGEDCVVFQEITDANQSLPKFNDKIIAKIEYK